MRDVLIDFLDQDGVDESASFNTGDFCFVEPKSPSLFKRREVNCAVMGAYDLRLIIEDVMRASDEDEAEWAKMQTHSDALSYALMRIMRTDIGRALVLDCRFENWSCDIVGLNEEASLSLATKIVTIPLPVSRVSQLALSIEHTHLFILSVFESLRRIWHVNVGVKQPTMWQFKDILLWNRCLRADLDLMTILFAFQDRAQGTPDLWRYVLASPLTDMAEQYAQMMTAMPIDLYSDDYFDTLADLYMQWFADETRINQTDLLTLSALDQALTKGMTSGIIGQNELTAHDIMGLSLFPKGGAPYLEVVASEILYNDEYRQFYSDIIEQHAIQLEDEIMDQDLSLSNVLIFRDPALQKLFSVDIMG